ncbi:MAG: SDR family oxidoreductase [Candidatus Hydrogenedentota bacterium]
MELRDRIALITGGNSGIGRAISLALAREGMHLGLVARDAARLEETAAEARRHTAVVHTYQADLTIPGDRGSVKASVDHDFGQLDVLVHCAGICYKGRIEESPAGTLLRQLEVNTIAPYALTHFFLPILRRRRGQVVFINSRAGLHVHAQLSQYCASKYALRAIADTLRAEVSADGVRVISVYPGKIATPLQQRIHKAAGHHYNPDLFPQPEDVARTVLHALTMPAGAEISDIVVTPQHEPGA